MSRRHAAALVPVLLLLLGAAGCWGRPARIQAPGFDPPGAAAKALELHDADGDRRITRQELAACAGLLAAFERFDADGDQALTADEVAAGVQTWIDDRLGMVQVGFRVLLDGRPLPGAVVRLVPEPCLGAAVSPAEGTTDETGGGSLQAEPAALPEHLRHLRVVQPGLYRVEITHPGQKLPARYNSQTELGLEVSQRSPGPAPVEWRLRAR